MPRRAAPQRPAAGADADQSAYAVTQTDSSPTATPRGSPPTRIVATTRRVTGSIRETVPSSVFATQTAPAPAAMPLAPRPTETAGKRPASLDVHRHDAVVEPVGDPDRAARDRSRRRREAELDRLLDVARARVEPPHPAIQRVAEHPQRAGADRELADLPARVLDGRRRAERDVGLLQLTQRPFAGGEPLHERAAGDPEHALARGDRARQQVRSSSAARRSKRRSARPRRSGTPGRRRHRPCRRGRQGRAARRWRGCAGAGPRRARSARARRR